MGMREAASIRRSKTNCLAKYTSVFSVKTRVTIEMPLRFKERISTRPGKPVMLSSIGIVTKRSTSSGERPGASLAICTCTFVTSGKASTDKRLVAIKPAISNTTAITKTRRRCCSARRTTFSIMVWLYLTKK